LPGQEWQTVPLAPVEQARPRSPKPGHDGDHHHGGRDKPLLAAAAAAADRHDRRRDRRLGQLISGAVQACLQIIHRQASPVNWAEIGAEPAGEGGASTSQARLDGPWWDAKLATDLVHRTTHQVVQHDRLALPKRQRS
jgi:hypothetical protein